MSLTWWWLIPLGLGALLAGAAPFVARRLQAETAALGEERRALGLAVSRARRAWPEVGIGSRTPADASSRPAPDTYPDIR